MTRPADATRTRRKVLTSLLAALGLAGLTLAALPDVAGAQSRDRGDRYQRATGGGGDRASRSGSSAARERTRPSSPAPRDSAPSRASRSSSRDNDASRRAFTPPEVRRDDGRSRTRFEDNTRFSTGRDRGERYDRARTASGRDSGGTDDYRRYERYRDSDTRNSRVGRLDYYDGGIDRDFRFYGGYHGYYGSPFYGRRYGYGYRPAFPRYYTPYYGSSYRADGYDVYGPPYGYPRSGLSVGLRYEEYYGPGDVFLGDPYHLPDGYVAPRYYYQSYRRTPVYRPYGYTPLPRYGYGFDADAVSAYDGGVVSETTTFETSGGLLPGFLPLGGYSAATTTREYRPFAFGCAPRTSVSYGIGVDLGGERLYPRYSYGNAPRYGGGVSVEYNSYSR